MTNKIKTESGYLIKSAIAGTACMLLFFGMLIIAHGAGSTVTATSSGAGGGSALFTPRYLPNIIQGAQGPADMIFFLYKYLMGLVGIIAVGVIMYAGVLYTVSADPAKIKQSNELIRNALKGIVLLFGAQVLFNTINPNIVDFPRIQSAIQPKAKFTPDVFTGRAIGLTTNLSDPTAVAAASATWAGESIGDRIMTGGNVVSEDNAMSRILSVGGGVAIKGCTLNTQSDASCLCTNAQRASGTKADGTGCVSFLGAKNKTMQEIVGFGKTVGSGMIITSVTDGHGVAGLTGSFHNTGDKFDMRYTPTVSSYIRTNFTKMSDTTDWMDAKPRTPKLERYQNPKTGAIYVYEPARGSRAAHWDVDTRPDAPPAEEG